MSGPGGESRNDLAGIERVVLLQTVDLFRFCRAEEILRISALAQERHLAAGEVIYEAGQPAQALFCIVRGGVRLETADGSRTALGPLHSFGVQEILSGRLRTATATAEEDTLVLAIDAEDLFDLLANNIEIVKALFRQLLRDAPPSREE